MRRLAASFAAACLVAAPLAMAQTAAPTPASSAPTATTATQPAPATTAVDPARLATANAIIAVAFPPAQRQQMLGAMLGAIARPLRDSFVLPPAVTDPGLKQLFRDFLDQTLHNMGPVLVAQLPQLLDAMARAYTREFSGDELNTVLTFAQSPAGAHFLSRSSQLLQDPDVQAALVTMNRAGQTAAVANAEEFKQKIAAYLKAHPQVARQMDQANHAPRTRH